MQGSKLATIRRSKLDLVKKSRDIHQKGLKGSDKQVGNKWGKSRKRMQKNRFKRFERNDKFAWGVRCWNGSSD